MSLQAHGYFMRLSNFIRTNTERIMENWESFASVQKPAADKMGRDALRNHITGILKFIADDIDSPQTKSEQKQKSEGFKENAFKNSAAEIHGDIRWQDGFDINQMASEYRALRASVINLWTQSQTEMNKNDLSDLIRFNEAIDQALTESVITFTEKLNLLLGILAHDLRNPLGAISMSAQLLLGKTKLDEKKKIQIETQIEVSAKKANQLVIDLLNLTRARLGSGIPVKIAPMDMEIVTIQSTKEIQAFHPDTEIVLETTGDLEGEWDGPRISQVFSNLIGNAVQYGQKGSPITVCVKGEEDEVIISVHNDGPPIPSGEIETIFNSLTRVLDRSIKTEEQLDNLGLGLYIAKEIVVAHGGTIGVTSSEEDGTVFTAQFPRAPLKENKA